LLKISISKFQDDGQPFWFLKWNFLMGGALETHFCIIMPNIVEIGSTVQIYRNFSHFSSEM